MITHSVRFPSFETRVDGRQSRAERRKAWLAAALLDLTLIALGFATPFSVRLVGDLPIAEILMLLLLPFLLAARGRMIFRRDLRVIYVLCALWLFAQIMSDWFHGMTSPYQWMRTYAAIIFFTFDIMMMAALTSGSTRRKLLFFGAYAVSGLVRARLFPTPFMEGEIWKFGYADGVITITLLASCYFYARRRNVVVVLFFLGLIAINLIENFRSPLLFLFVVLAIVVPVIPERLGRLQLLPRRGSASRVAAIVVFSLTAGFVAKQVLVWVTDSGIVDQEAQEKNKSQLGSGGAMHLFFAARPEFPVAMKAIADRPLLGHGSAPDEPKYQAMLNDMQEEMGQQNMFESALETLGGMIPVHSYLLQAWVAAGILGSLVWFYLLALCVKSIIRAAILLPPTAPYITYMFIMFFWNIFFSPFGSTVRLVVAGTILFMVDLPDSAVTISSMARQPHRFGWQRGRWTRQQGTRPVLMRP